MPKADWKKWADCTALPTTHTSESQPDTGKGSAEASYSTSPTSCSSWRRSSPARRSSSLRVCSRLMRRCDTRPARCATSVAELVELHVRGTWPPVLLCTMHSWRMVERRRLDALDVALLTALREHPRAGALELSRITGVARATVSARLQRLENDGVVTGYGPDVDVSAAGFGVEAFVTLEIAQGAIEDVQRDLEAIPGLLEAHATTGSGDVLCRVAASSHEALQQVLVDLNRSPAVVRSTSVVALSQLVPFRTLPLLASEAAPGAGRSAMGTRPPGAAPAR